MRTISKAGEIFPMSPAVDDDAAGALLFSDREGRLLFETYAYEVGFFRFNWHPSLEILMVLRGSLNSYSENGVRLLRENDFLVINPNVGHASILLEPKTVALVIHISQGYLEELCEGNPVPTFSCWSGQDEEKERAVYEQIRRSTALVFCSMQRGEAANRLMAQSQIFLILSLLMKNFSEEAPSTRAAADHLKQGEIVHSMVKYINRRFREKLTLEQLAAYVNRNPSYISNYFRQATGLGFHDYLIRKRLTYAAYLLHNSDDSILDIALDAGFPDAKALNQAFKKYFQISPGQYRRRLLENGDKSVRQLFPVKLEFDDPLLARKLKEYLSSPTGENHRETPKKP